MNTGETTRNPAEELSPQQEGAIVALLSGPGLTGAKAQALLVELDRDIHWNRNWLGRVFSW